MEAKEWQRRLPSVDRKISELTPQDIRVRLTGTVIDRQDERIILDDGSGKIGITFDQPTSLEPNQLVRVFGRLIAMENGFELQGEIAQDMSKLDVNLYEKMKGAENKFKL